MIGVFSIHKAISNTDKRVLNQLIEHSLSDQGSACGCCNIKLHTGVGVAYVDSNPENIQKENIVAVCKLCEALHNGGKLNNTDKFGWLIYMPHLTQKALIRLAHGIHAIKRIDGINISFCVELSGKEMGKLRILAGEKLGFSDCSALEDFLSIITPEAYEKRQEGLGGIRWWPNTENNVFAAHLTEYKESFLSEGELKLMSKKITG